MLLSKFCTLIKTGLIGTEWARSPIIITTLQLSGLGGPTYNYTPVKFNLAEWARWIIIDVTWYILATQRHHKYYKHKTRTLIKTVNITNVMVMIIITSCLQNCTHTDKIIVIFSIQHP